MKSLLKICMRYFLTAVFLIFGVLIFNLFLFSGYSIWFYNKNVLEDFGLGREGMEQISASLYEENGEWKSGEDVERRLKEGGCEFAFLLDEDGNRVWSWQVPGEIPEKYSAGEIASFVRWYLNDYPVYSWKCHDGMLFVAAYPKGVFARTNLFWPRKQLEGLGNMAAIMFLANLILVPVLTLFFGWRFFKALKPVGKGIEALAQGQKINLEEKGILGDLKRKINRAGTILETQKEALEKRDSTRTEWIAGVSHDIRTPLSLIMGYADQMQQDVHMDEKNRKLAEMMREQSIFIRNLIEDLNLTSKLTYHARPLRLQEYCPAALLRKITAGFYDSGELTENYSLTLEVAAGLEREKYVGDTVLLERLFKNLIGNSIRHNPDGCRIRFSAWQKEEGFVAAVSDDGSGIPEAVRKKVQAETTSDQEPHVMGILVAAKIAQAHEGSLSFSEDGKTVFVYLQNLSRQSILEKNSKRVSYDDKNR